MKEQKKRHCAVPRLRKSRTWKSKRTQQQQQQQHQQQQHQQQQKETRVPKETTSNSGGNGETDRNGDESLRSAIKKKNPVKLGKTPTPTRRN